MSRLKSHGHHHDFIVQIPSTITITKHLKSNHMINIAPTPMIPDYFFGVVVTASPCIMFEKLWQQLQGFCFVIPLTITPLSRNTYWNSNHWINLVPPPMIPDYFFAVVSQHRHVSRLRNCGH